MTAGLSANAWEAVGFLGQGLFTARFLVQWLASEKKGESVVPVSFWWLSLVGSAVLAVYAAFGRSEPVFLLVSLINGFLYARNLYLAYFAKDRPTSRKVLIPSVLAIAAFLVFVGSGKVDPKVPVGWLALGFVGTACWSGRFVIQWYASERAGRSVMPRSFWYVGLAGALLLLSYSIYRKMPVFILAYLFPLFPYIRNLTLIFRKEGAPRPIRLAQEMWRDPGRRGNAVTIFCVVLAAFLALRAARTDSGSDFERLHRAAQLTVEGRGGGMYEGHDSFRHPPALAVVLAPMGWFPGRAAVAIWTVLNGLAFLLAMHLLFQLVRRNGVRAAWMWIPFLIGVRFAWDAMNGGDPMPLLLLLLVGGLERAARERDRSAVLLFSLGTIFSPLLAGAAAWCAGLAERRAGIVLGTLLVSSMLAVLLPATVFGPAGALSAVDDYAAAVFLPRLTVAIEHGPFSWRAEPLPLVVGGAALAAFAIWLLRKAGRDPGVVYGSLAALWLALVGRVDHENFLFLILPAAALVFECAARGWGRTRTRVGVAALLAALALAAVGARAIVGRETSEFLLDHGSLPAAAGLLFVGLLVSGWGERDGATADG